MEINLAKFKKNKYYYPTLGLLIGFLVSLLSYLSNYLFLFLNKDKSDLYFYIVALLITPSWIPIFLFSGIAGHRWLILFINLLLYSLLGLALGYFYKTDRYSTKIVLIILLFFLLFFTFSCSQILLIEKYGA